MENNLRTMGALRHSDIAAGYCNADIVFLPTLLECSSAVYPESFNAEVPLCTSDIDFARELCGDAAEYFDPFDPGSAARAIDSLIASPERRKALVQNGRRVLQNNFPSPAEKWEAQLECLESIYASGR